MGIEQFIDNEVKANDVVLFMKGTPQFPMCGFSGQVVQILDHLGVAYKGINVLESDEIRNGIKSYSNWPTIPALSAIYVAQTRSAPQGGDCTAAVTFLQARRTSPRPRKCRPD